MFNAAAAAAGAPFGQRDAAGHHADRQVQQTAPDFHISEMLFMGLGGRGHDTRGGGQPAPPGANPESAYVMINPYSGEVTNKTMLPGPPTPGVRW